MQRSIPARSLRSQHFWQSEQAAKFASYLLAEYDGEPAKRAEKTIKHATLIYQKTPLCAAIERFLVLILLCMAIPMHMMLTCRQQSLGRPQNDKEAFH